jgi:integrase
MFAASVTQLAGGEVGIDEKPAPERRTIGQLLDALKDDFEVRGKASVKNLNLIAIVKTDLADQWADAFKSKDVTKYVASLQKPAKSKTGRRTKGLANSTIKHRLQVLASAYELENTNRDQAEIDRLIVPRFPRFEEGAPRSGFLNPSQFEVLLSHLPEDLRDFCQFAYLVGWRKSAVAGLEWSDVRDGNIYLRSVLSKNRRPYFVPIEGELVSLIERRKQARSIETPHGVVLSNLVFHRDGARIAEFRKSWGTATKKAGCPGTLFHDLRRSAARNMIRSRVTRDVAKKVGGWKTDSIFSRYNVTDEVDLQDAMRKVTQYNEVEGQKVVTMAQQGRS